MRYGSGADALFYAVARCPFRRRWREQDAPWLLKSGFGFIGLSCKPCLRCDLNPPPTFWVRVFSSCLGHMNIVPVGARVFGGLGFGLACVAVGKPFVNFLTKGILRDCVLLQRHRLPNSRQLVD